MDKRINLEHGDGGRKTNILIQELFYKYFDNDLLINSLDSSVFQIDKSRIAFTTDSYVIKPLFFPGGDIGKLSVCGTINDLSVTGARPLYLSCGFIIEEGFLMEELERIVISMALTCKKENVKIITGDTKVVEGGNAEGIYINTSGIGIVENDYRTKNISIGDKIIITGTIGDHGTAIALERYNINANVDILSDCSSIHGIVGKIMKYEPSIKLMKDPTRGGIATSLNEIAKFTGRGIEIYEEELPIDTRVNSLTEILGLDPLYLANEGKLLIVVDSNEAEEILEYIKTIDGCSSAAIVGSFVSENRPIVYMKTRIGGRRIINQLEGRMLPRIC